MIAIQKCYFLPGNSTINNNNCNDSNDKSCFLYLVQYFFFYTRGVLVLYWRDSSVLGRVLGEFPY